VAADSLPLLHTTHFASQQASSSAPPPAARTMANKVEHLRSTHALWSLPGPPNDFLSKQFLHVPQSSRVHPTHFPHRRRTFLVALPFLRAVLAATSSLPSSSSSMLGAPSSIAVIRPIPTIASDTSFAVIMTSLLSFLK
jgi:hypothetical protein